MGAGIVSPNHKFSFVASSALTSDELEPVLMLGDNVWPQPNCRWELDSEWKTWIGSIRTETIEEDCNLFLCAALDSASPGVLDDENKQLNATVSLLFDALMLTGNIQTNGTPILISGANQGDGLSIRHLSELIPPLIPAGVDYQELTAPMLKEAFALMKP